MAVEPGIYEHFKGERYEVFAVGKHSETEEPLVLYRTLYGDYGFWARPLAMFEERVESDGYSGPHFVRIA
ncbi:DUF1653 domain-containing protein [Microbacterium sp.]|uniref:DUF1653 domain-containing protein n=1 Tax=Microbacterium sp. TaxID=51671 RepID=UPI0009275B67|nr:DUF1653 domain-containing protein [Microbacterium sp.]MBN9180520.1 DUF1653 domain-containing protein [Microbacterium sp.]MBN9193741.1 DUF1653 domain-containing protein [Microbacterium sp.]OJU57370.1 MAG: hypothetical protein BGO04_15060 [Microbacterium sp. 70-38]